MLGRRGHLLSALIMAGIGTVAEPSSAGEFFARPNPTGLSDIRAAELPPPGLYVSGLFIGARTPDLYDLDGNGLFPDTSGRVEAGGAAVLLAYPFEVFGGRLASSVGGFCGRFQLKVTAGFRRGDTRGCTDLFSDIFFWSRSFYHQPPADGPPGAGFPPLPAGLTVGFGLNVTFPIGTFPYAEGAPPPDRVPPGSPGLGRWVISPNVALTYRTPPILLQGTEFSARAFFNFFGETRHTQYETGSNVTIDWAVTERFGRFQFGPTGTFLYQFEDDRGPPGSILAADGKQRTKLTEIGGVFAVDLPEYGAQASIKYFKSIDGENIFGGHAVIARLSLKLM